MHVGCGMHVLAVKLNIEYTLTNTQCNTTTLVIVTDELLC